MSQKITKTLAAACALCLFGGVQQEANAATIIELSDGITTVSVADGSASDLSTTPGVVVFSGIVGVFDVNVTTGLSYPLLGSLSEPIMDLNSVNVSSGGTGTLTVKLTTTDYTGPLIDSTRLDTGGTTNGSILVESFVDTGNSAFGTATQTGSLGTFSTGPFAGTSTSLPGLTASPYSATIVATIVHDDPQDVTSFDAEYRIVPEPGTLALIGLGGLFVARRRRRA